MAAEKDRPKWAPSVRVWTNICMTHRRPWSPFFARWQQASRKAWIAGYMRLPYFRRKPLDREDAVTRRVNIFLKNGRMWEGRGAKVVEAKHG